MLQRFASVSILLLSSASMYSMEIASLKQLVTKKVAVLIAHDPRSCVKALYTLPCNLNISLIQHLMLTNKHKSALPLIALGYQRYQQQHDNNKHSRIHVTCSDDQEIQLTSEQSKQLIQASSSIRNLIQDMGIQDNAVHVEDIPLPLLTQRQVTALLFYLSITNALNTSSTLPIVQQEIPETAALSSYWIKYTALQQLKEYITACTIPALCDLIIAAHYLDIQASERAINFAELVTQALASKLIQSPIYQDEYNVINTLPQEVKKVLVCHLIDNSIVRYALCGNSTDTIINTAHTLIGHTRSIKSVSWSPDGKYIASGSGDKTVRVWDATTDTCIHTLTDHTNEVISVSWSPDGKHIASSSDDTTIRIWDASTGTCIHILNDHTHGVNSVAWSPDSKYIASGSSDNTVRVWDASTGTCIHTLTDHIDTVNSVSWSPDGSLIASCSNDYTIKVWNATTGSCIHTLIEHDSSVNSVSWSPDSNMIASSDDSTIKIGDITTGTCIRTLTGHDDWIRLISWSYDGKYIASCSDDKTIRVWDAQSGTCIHILKGHTRWVMSVSWSSDSSKLASSARNKTVKIWDIVNKEFDTYLKNTVSWQQALLLVRIINQHDIDFAEDSRARQCYNSLDQRVKQVIALYYQQRETVALTVTCNV